MKRRFISVMLVGMITGVFNLLYAQISYSGCSNSGTGSNALGVNSMASGNYSLAIRNSVKSIAANSFTLGSGTPDFSGRIALNNTVENSFLLGFDGTPVLFAKLKPSFLLTGAAGQCH